MTKKIITCITCPLGCTIAVCGEGGEIASMEGSKCKRGEEYAQNEFTHPVRILTTTVRVENADSPLVAVRSDKPISKKLLMQCMAEIKNVAVMAPVRRYDIIIPNILGTDANIVATGEVGEKTQYRQHNSTSSHNTSSVT